MNDREALWEDIFRKVIEERRRQVGRGYSPEHDDRHGKGELAVAALLYALPRSGGALTEQEQQALQDALARETGGWRVTRLSGDRKQDLISAMALLVSEYERVDRAGR